MPSKPTKTQKRRARRHRTRGTSHGPDNPIDDAACIYIVIPVIPLAGTVGPHAGDIGGFINHHFEPWLAEKNLLTKGLAVKIGRGRSVPLLMREDLEKVQKATRSIDNRVKRFSGSLLGYGFELSVGKTAEDAMEVILTDEAPGEKREATEAATPALPRAGRAPGGKSSAIN